MPDIVEVYGWQMAMDRWLDETGIFHLSVRRHGAGGTETACGLTRIRLGGVERNTERGHRCQKCQWAADKRERQRAAKRS